MNFLNENPLLITYLFVFILIIQAQCIFEVKDNGLKSDETTPVINQNKSTSRIKCNATTTPYLNTCDANARIVGGLQAVPYSWPAQVLVFQNIKGDYIFDDGDVHTISSNNLCGGTLINRYTILTAAHCIKKEISYTSGGPEPPAGTYPLPVYTNGNPYFPTVQSMFTVYVGAFDISFLQLNKPPTTPTVAMKVKKVIMHPNYDSKNELNDIALLILQNPVDLNIFVQPACLPNPLYELDLAKNYEKAKASGWGSLYEGGSTSMKLYNVELTVYDGLACMNVFPNEVKLWNRQICAGKLEGGKDTCQGDSGGGLYVFDSNINKYVIVGITSYGDGCGQTGKPGIYTRVSFYYDWISANWATSAGFKIKFSLLFMTCLVTIMSFICEY